MSNVYVTYKFTATWFQSLNMILKQLFSDIGQILLDLSTYYHPLFPLNLIFAADSTSLHDNSKYFIKLYKHFSQLG